MEYYYHQEALLGLLFLRSAYRALVAFVAFVCQFLGPAIPAALLPILDPGLGLRLCRHD